MHSHTYIHTYIRTKATTVQMHARVHICIYRCLGGCLHGVYVYVYWRRHTNYCIRNCGTVASWWVEEDKCVLVMALHKSMNDMCTQAVLTKLLISRHVILKSCIPLNDMEQVSGS